MEHRRPKRARIVLLAAEGTVPDRRAISEVIRVTYLQIGAAYARRHEKRSSPRVIQRNDMADDMTKLNEFQALNNEELDSVGGGCTCTGTLSQRKLEYSC